jgi:asparagine synthase (glutamine-hydrolysing)
MCGIAGIAVSREDDSVDYVATMERMLRAMNHRGPDDCGWTQVARRGSTCDAVLGATRLAILDLSLAGHQPMRDPLTGNYIVLNGEIYNHLDIRAELGSRVPEWLSGCDTETLLRAYGVWGINCVERLRGMFAFALWDAQKGHLWCGRDRLGIKPLYITQQNGRVLFASEVRALIASRMVSVALDEVGLAGYLRFGSAVEPATLLCGIHSVPPGHIVRISRGRIEETRKYWRVADVKLSSQMATPQTIRQELERAVREHLLSDVPVACFLSGGLDSSVITALAARSTGQVLHTFSVGFSEVTHDESGYAASVAKMYGTDHHSVRLSEEEILSQVPVAVEAMDLPSGDGVNTYIVSRAVAQANIKVVLSGLGGDELFGGYKTFFQVPFVHKWARLLELCPDSWKSKMRGQRGIEIAAAGLSLKQRYEVSRAYWSNQEIRSFGAFEETHYDAEDWSADAPATSRISALELQGYMRSTLLRDSDAMSMALSLELRVPFLDHLLVETCLGGRTAIWGKIALLNATRDLVPPAIFERPKQGFVLPIERWIRGPLREFAVEGMGRLWDMNIISAGSPRRLVADFERGEVSGSRLWQLIVLGYWAERNRVSKITVAQDEPSTVPAISAAFI